MGNLLNLDAFSDSRARLATSDDPPDERSYAESDRSSVDTLFGPVRYEVGKWGTREALEQYAALGRPMPLYLVGPGVFEKAFGGGYLQPEAYAISDVGFPRPPSRECFISWGSGALVEPTGEVSQLLQLGVQRGKAERVRFLVRGVYVYEPDGDREDWELSAIIQEQWMRDGRWTNVLAHPLDLAIGAEGQVYFFHPGAEHFARTLLDACSSYKREQQVVSKARRKKMQKQGRLPPSAFYVVSQHLIRQPRPCQGGTHASPSFEYDVRGHWAFRVKRVQGELTGKERERMTRKNTGRREYQFIEHPPTPEQHQFLRDIGRTPPGKGQYVRVTKYWVSGHTRGPEDAPHVHAIKVMDDE